MSTPVVRVLVVDDFEEWRRELRAILEQRPTLRVVGEAANGQEAVQQAHLLRPDLILLDIGLPVLNGIEVARRLRDSKLQSKILVVSENRRREIAEEALRTGTFGYVIKSQAGSELLLAVDAVLQGKEFVSAFLRTQDPPARKAFGSSPCHGIDQRSMASNRSGKQNTLDFFHRRRESSRDPRLIGKSNEEELIISVGISQDRMNREPGPFQLVFHVPSCARSFHRAPSASSGGRVGEGCQSVLALQAE